MEKFPGLIDSLCLIHKLKLLISDEVKTNSFT